MHELSIIPRQCTEVAEAISSALNINVDIIDSNLIRVAAAGYYSNKLGFPMRYGTISKHVLKTKKIYSVINPDKDPVCLKCPGYSGNGKCLHKACISAPILLDNEVIGTINLLSLTEEQEIYIQNNRDRLAPFLKKMSEIIVTELIKEEATAKNEQLVAELSTILSSVNCGIILTDYKNRIIKINASAYRILHLPEGDSFEGIKIDELFPNIHDQVNFDHGRKKIRVNAKSSITTKELVADISPIFKEKVYLGMVIHFESLSDYVPLANAMVSQHHDISFETIIGSSKKINDTKTIASRFAKGNSTILIEGESGTGKELLARAIHNASPRRDKAFVAVNCGALPETLIESELFGYVKGAFTGASPNGKIGMFEMANHGTIFLDEISTMPIYLQAKLLRVIQEREIVRIGATKPVSIDVRIIAATNVNLAELVKAGQFRQDLYFRIDVLPIEVPPLRERMDDIVPLTEYFIGKYCILLQKNCASYDASFLEMLMNYSWPGNVRELQNAIEYSVNLMTDYESSLTSRHLPGYLFSYKNNKPEKHLSAKEYKIETIYSLLQEYGNSAESKKRIAEELGIGVSTVYRLLAKHEKK